MSPCLNAVGGVVCTRDTYVIYIRGKMWRFDFHPFLGPEIVNRHGDPISRQPGERSKFWLGFGAWLSQGQRVEDGVCLWTHPPVAIVEPISGRNYRLVGEVPFVGPL